MWKIWILKCLGYKYGPFMIPVRDYWLFIDTYQRIWKIRYTGYYEDPIEILMLEK